MYQCTVCLCKCVILKQCISTAYFIEALHEKKQTITTNDSEFAKLKAQVEEFKASSAEKDTLVAKCLAMVKESEGENIWCCEIHELKFLEH